MERWSHNWESRLARCDKCDFNLFESRHLEGQIRAHETVRVNMHKPQLSKPADFSCAAHVFVIYIFHAKACPHHT